MIGAPYDLEFGRPVASRETRRLASPFLVQTRPLQGHVGLCAAQGLKSELGNGLASDPSVLSLCVSTWQSSFGSMPPLSASRPHIVPGSLPTSGRK